MNKTVIIFFIIAFNLVPVFGVLYYNWQPFEAFWFFWVETLIVACFNCIRIVFSQSSQQPALNTTQPLTYNINKGIKYLLIRIGIFIFYSIFIIVFIGFVANTNTDKGNVLGTILFQNKFFNLSLLISIVSQGYYLVFYFFRNGAFITARPDSYAAIFDSRQLVIHIAVVIGALGGIFITKNTSFSNYSNTFIISLLCLCKCAAELFNYKAAATIQQS
ncbi:MAG: hypothetical protein IPP81_15980 [Chitinophagaceae bacterium]|nr:hypothetical protein [Chitinophagaceae bacterium]